MAHPEWAVKYRRKGTELRCINGRYCLYECSCVYDKETKRHRKVTGKYLGSITEAGGFKPSRKREMEKELDDLKAGKTAAPAEAKPGSVKEYGLSWAVGNVFEPLCKPLKELFPAEYDRLMALAYCRLRYQSPMKDVLGDYGDSWLSTQKGTSGLSANTLTDLFRRIGDKRPEMVKYMRSFCGEAGDIIFDGSDLLSSSRKMDIPQMTKTKEGTFENAIDIMFVYSIANRLPAYFRIMPGNIKDVKAFQMCMNESGAKDGVAIVDKTFPSEANLKFLEEEKIRYIASMRRSTAGLDYSVFASRDNTGAQGHFTYEKRIIWWSEQELGGRKVFLYFDEEHRIDENKDYLNRVDSGKWPDKYTMEGYHKHAMMFGTLALVTNAGRTAEKTYEAYKTRCEVEQAIDVFKNALEADRTYMQNEQALETHVFVNFIAMQWYYLLRNRLADANLLSRFSPMEIVKQLCRVRTVYVNGKWQKAEITKKEEAVFKALGFSIT